MLVVINLSFIIFPVGTISFISQRKENNKYYLVEDMLSEIAFGTANRSLDTSISLTINLLVKTSALALIEAVSFFLLL